MNIKYIDDKVIKSYHSWAQSCYFFLICLSMAWSMQYKDGYDGLFSWGIYFCGQILSVFTQNLMRDCQIPTLNFPSCDFTTMWWRWHIELILLKLALWNIKCLVECNMALIMKRAAGGSPCDKSQGLPRAFSKSNKPPIS